MGKKYLTILMVLHINEHHYVRDYINILLLL